MSCRNLLFDSLAFRAQIVMAALFIYEKDRCEIILPLRFGRIIGYLALLLTK